MKRPVIGTPWADAFIGYRLSIQRALWGMVTPSLRAVALGWEDDVARARFVFEREPTEHEVELVSEVETEVLAVSTESTRTAFTIEVVPSARLDYRVGEMWWAYVRHEAPSSDDKDV